MIEFFWVKKYPALELTSSKTSLFFEGRHGWKIYQKRWFDLIVLKAGRQVNTEAPTLNPSRKKRVSDRGHLSVGKILSKIYPKFCDFYFLAASSRQSNGCSLANCVHICTPLNAVQWGSWHCVKTIMADKYEWKRKLQNFGDFLAHFFWVRW